MSDPQKLSKRTPFVCATGEFCFTRAVPRARPEAKHWAEVGGVGHGAVSPGHLGLHLLPVLACGSRTNKTHVGAQRRLSGLRIYPLTLCGILRLRNFSGNDPDKAKSPSREDRTRLPDFFLFYFFRSRNLVGEPSPKNRVKGDLAKHTTPNTPPTIASSFFSFQGCVFGGGGLFSLCFFLGEGKGVPPRGGESFSGAPRKPKGHHPKAPLIAMAMACHGQFHQNLRITGVPRKVIRMPTKRGHPPNHLKAGN